MISQQRTNQQSIQSPLELMMKNLFNDFLQDEDMRPIISLNPQQILKLLILCSYYFHKNIQKKYKRILTFLANYHKIVHLYALQSQTYMTNDIAVHFINLLAYSRLKHNLVDEARNIYKNIWTYVDIKSCDKLLISIALNNLGYLHQKNYKHFKSLECHLKVIDLMGKRLGDLKRQNKKSQLIEDSVILISSLIHCQKTLKSILQNDQKKTKSFYSQLFQYINEIGYKCSKKYLGQKSQFTKVFLQNYRNYEKLPVFLEQDQSVERTSLQHKILQQLQGIYEVLKTKRQPEIVYVKQQKSIQESIKQVFIVQKSQKVPQIQPSQQSLVMQPLPKTQQQQQMESGNQISQTINGWNVALYFLRSKQVSNRIKTDEIYAQFITGMLVVECKKNRKQMKTIISQQRLQKILGLINIQSTISPDYNLKNMSDEQYFSKIVFPHVQIQDDGNLSFSIQKKSLFLPFQSTFLEQQSFVSFHHIQQNKFRVIISTMNGTQTLYLDLEFSSKTLIKILQINQKKPSFIAKAYQTIKQLNYKKQIEIPQMQNYDITQVILINQILIKNIIQKILQDLQAFILEFEQQDSGNLKLSDFLNAIQNDQQNQMTYLSFKQIQICGNNKTITENKNAELFFRLKGQFSLCRYLQNICAIQVFCQNNYKTFDIESQSQAKGTTMIYPDKFEKQFGISIKTVEKQGLMLSLLEMLSKRYQLKVFSSHLKTYDEQLYNQNAIYELPLSCKSSKRSIVKDEDGYMIPVTISHLTLNNSVPLAFRIDAYFPCQGGAQYSVLVKVRDILWEKPQNIKKQEQEKNTNNNENQEKYQAALMSKQKLETVIKKQHFLSEWCELQGYDLLLKNIKIDNMKIKLKGSMFRFFSLQRILDHIIERKIQ